jgi:hypothetical protein
LVSVEHLQERFLDQLASQRHPRTGVGLRDGTLVMVTVDGRQPGYSEGMTLAELASLFIELKCVEAMNLDGGGSTTMVVRDRVMNSPSGGAPRAVANALALFSTAPLGPPAQLLMEPTEVSVLSGDTVGLRVGALDQYYSPVAVGAEEVEWQCASALGSVDEGGRFTAAEVSGPTLGLVMARSGKLTAASVVRVLSSPARVVVRPGEVALAPGEVQRFFVQAYDDQNHPVNVSAGRATWSCEPAGAGGTVDASGVLRAPLGEARLTVVARVGEVSGGAAVTVSARPTIVEDFEREGQWSYEGSPAGVPGSVEWAEDPLQPGNHCLRLRYDFGKQGGTRTAHAVLSVSLPAARGLSVRVFGDGQGGWLRARVRDGAGRTLTEDLAHRVDWSGEWKRLIAWLPEEVEGPVVLESVYVAEYDEEVKSAGEILLDDIGVVSVSEAPGEGVGKEAGKAGSDE